MRGFVTPNFLRHGLLIAGIACLQLAGGALAIAQDADSNSPPADTQASAQDASQSGTQGAPLKGFIEEEGSASGKKQRLHGQAGQMDTSQPKQGNATDDALQGGAEDQGLVPFTEEKPKAGSDNAPLSGSIQDEGSSLMHEDPDAQDSELMIQWDRWRNRLLHAVQDGMQNDLNNPNDINMRWDPTTHSMVSKFPLGTEAWFYCQVTPDEHIIHARIVHSSGNKSYDEAVLTALDNLQGSSILKYPAGSKRTIVSQVAGIKTADTSDYKYFHFGDVERQIIPGN
jgi:hypothetical protein